jgi:hypothetical protein
MSFCHNPNSPLYKHLQKRYGRDAVNYAMNILTSDAFLSWYGKEIPNNIRGGVLTNRKGETFDLNLEIENYLRDISGQVDHTPVSKESVFEYLKSVVPFIKDSQVNWIEQGKQGTTRMFEGIIYLESDILDSPLGMVHVRHEAMHLLLYHSPDKEQILRDVRASSEYSNWMILNGAEDNLYNQEEFLAEKYGVYQYSPPATLNSAIRVIRNAIKAFKTYMSNLIKVFGQTEVSKQSISDIFDRIETGNFGIKEDIRNTDNLPKFVKRITKLFPATTYHESLMKYTQGSLWIKNKAKILFEQENNSPDEIKKKLIKDLYDEAFSMLGLSKDAIQNEIKILALLNIKANISKRAKFDTSEFFETIDDLVALYEDIKYFKNEYKEGNIDETALNEVLDATTESINEMIGLKGSFTSKLGRVLERISSNKNKKAIPVNDYMSNMERLSEIELIKNERKRIANEQRIKRKNNPDYIPTYSDEQFAVLDLLAYPETYNQVFADVFQYANTTVEITDEIEAIFKMLDEGNYDSISGGGINDMESNMNVDNESRLSQELKMLLSFITYQARNPITGNTDTMYLSPKIANAKLLELLNIFKGSDSYKSIKKEGVSKVKAFLSFLESRLISIDSSSNVSSIKDSSFIDYIYGLIKGKKINDLIFVNGANQFLKTNEDLKDEKITYKNGSLFKEGKLIYLSSDEYTTSEMLTDFHKRFIKKYEQGMFNRNNIIRILHELASQEKMMAHSGYIKVSSTSSGEEGGVDTTYSPRMVRNKPLSPAQRFSDSLVSEYSNKKNITSFIAKVLSKFENADVPINYENLYRLTKPLSVVLGQSFEELTTNDLYQLYREAHAFRNLLKDYQNDTNLDSAFYSFGSKLANILGLEAAPSWKDSKNNNRFQFITGSWFYDALRDASVNNEKISIESDVVDLDAFSFQDMTPKQMQNFTAQDFFSQSFFVGFVAQMAQSNVKGSKQYYQQIWTQSNRNRLSYVKVRALNNKTAKSQFEKVQENSLKFTNNVKKAMAIADKLNQQSKVNKETRQESFDKLSETDKALYKKYFLKNVVENVEKLETDGVKHPLGASFYFMNNENSTYEDMETYAANRAMDALIHFLPYVDSKLLNDNSQLKNLNKDLAKDFTSNEAYKSNLQKIIDTDPNSSMIDLNQDRGERVVSSAKETTQMLYTMMYNWTLNNLINGYELNTQVYGNMHTAKHLEELVKRMQGANSPGKTQIIDSEVLPDGTYARQLGNKPFSNAIISREPISSISAVNDPRGLFMKIHGLSDMADGAMLSIPHTLRNTIRGTQDTRLGGLIKKVINYVENGTVKYIKTNEFVLTDEFVRLYPELATIREKMENSMMSEKDKTLHKSQYDYLYRTFDQERYNTDTDYASQIDLTEAAYLELLERNDNNIIEYNIYPSAFKTGSLRSDDYVDLLNGDEIGSLNTFKLDNSQVRIQGNPISTSKQISDFSQFIYFLNTPVDSTTGERLNEDLAFRIYNIQREIQQLQRAKNGAYLDPEKAPGLAQNEYDDTSFNMTYGKLNQPGVSLWYPTMIGRYVIHHVKNIHKNISSIKHSGLKLILQSAVGIEVYEDDNGKITIGDKEALAEYYKQSDATRYMMREFKSMQREYKSAGKPITGVVFFNNFKEHLKNTGMVVSNDITIDTLTSWSKMNIPRKLRIRDENNMTEVIAPMALRDYLIAKGINPDEAFTTHQVPESLLTQLGVRIPTTGIHSAIPMRIVGYIEGSNTIIAPEELVSLHGSDFDVDAIYSIHREVFTKNVEYGEYSFKIGQGIGYTEDNVPIDLEVLKEILPTYLYIDVLKNRKIDAYLELVTRPENAESMNTPITNAIINEEPVEGKETRSLKAKLKELLGDTYFYNSKDINTPQSLYDFHRDNFEGKSGTGIQANAMKAFSYILNGAKMSLVTEDWTKIDVGMDEILDIVATSEKLVYDVVTKNGTFENVKIVREPVLIYKEKRHNVEKRTVFTAPNLREDTPMNQLRFINIEGDMTYELGDSVLNGYIDNVKEQITSLLNANKNNIFQIALMIQMGYPINYIGVYMQQPYLKYATSSGRLNIKSIIENIKSTIAFTPEDDINYLSVSNLENNTKYLANIVKAIELIHGVQINPLSITPTHISIYLKEEGSEIESIKNEAGEVVFNYESFLKTQYAVLDNYLKFKKISDTGDKITKMLTVVQDTPVEIEKIEEIVDIIKELKRGSNFDSPNLLKTPNVEQAIKQIIETLQSLHDTIPIYSEKFNEFTNKLAQGLNLEMDNLTTSIDIARHKFVRSNLLKYLLQDVFNDANFLQKIGYDPNMKALSRGEAKRGYSSDYAETKEKTTAAGRAFTVTEKIMKVSPKEVLMNNIAKEMYNLRNEIQLSENKNNVLYTNDLKILLNYFSISLVNEKYEMEYVGGTTIKEGDPIYASLQRGMADLSKIPNTNYVTKMIAYSILSTGGSFGFKNFDNLFPPIESQQGAMDGLSFVSRIYEKAIDKIADNPEMIIDDFVLQMMQINPENFKKTKVYGENWEVSDDKMTATFSTDTPESRPLYIVDEKGFMYKREDMTVPVVSIDDVRKQKRAQGEEESENGTVTYKRYNNIKGYFSEYKTSKKDGELTTVFEPRPKVHYDPLFESGTLELDYKINDTVFKKLMAAPVDTPITHEYDIDTENVRAINEELRQTVVDMIPIQYMYKREVSKNESPILKTKTFEVATLRGILANQNTLEASVYEDVNGRYTYNVLPVLDEDGDVEKYKISRTHIVYKYTVTETLTKTEEPEQSDLCNISTKTPQVN